MNRAQKRMARRRQRLLYNADIAEQIEIQHKREYRRAKKLARAAAAAKRAEQGRA